MDLENAVLGVRQQNPVLNVLQTKQRGELKLKKPHITTSKTFEFTHPNGKQKIKLTEKEALEFLDCLAETLGHMHMPVPLGDLFKQKPLDSGQIKGSPSNPIDLIGKEFPRPLDIIYGTTTCATAN